MSDYTELRAKAEAARDAINAHAALHEDDRAEGAAYARKDAAMQALLEALALTPAVLFDLLGVLACPAGAAGACATCDEKPDPSTCDHDVACSICGTRWHTAAEIPTVRDRQKGRPR